MNKEYKLNDIVYYLPDGYLLAIECKILEIDDYFRQKEPQAYLFYDLDEPVGHSVASYELYDSKEDALNALKKRNEQELRDRKDPKCYFKESYNSNQQLEEYRKQRINFIVNTWENYENKDEEKEKWFKELEDKKYNEKWFNINSLEIEELIKKYGNIHRNVITSSIEFLNKHEPKWNLDTPVDKDKYIREILQLDKD